MRKIIDINSDWRFIREDAGLPASLPTNWQRIDLPHTWNAIDGNDGNGAYYRGVCWYAKEFDTPSLLAGYRLYVEIPAASQSGRVFVNGKEVCYHEGGYSNFRADITDALSKDGKNLLAICVSNAETTHIYPQMADFTFYGGLYRGVNLITVAPTHFDLDFWGTQGLKVAAKPVGTGAEISLEAWVKNADENYTVRYQIINADGEIAAEAWRPAANPAVTLSLPDAHLWQGVDDPYLYTCNASIVRRNETVDEVSCRFGVREFSVDPEKGFFLNGKSMPLRGVSRHQDKLGKGVALTREDHYEDAKIIAELGANTIRLAHYQHSQDFYDACDEYGFVVWAEIPFISSQSDDPTAHENCRTQIQELVHQNINHASICFWGISNEITIAGEKPHLIENHKDLNALVKSIDSTRLTTIAHVSMVPLDSALHGITDVESYNHYFGWYGGTYDINEQWFDNFHKVHPEICVGLSEYGAEGIITYQPDDPKCRDYSEAYQAEYHEHMAKIIAERDYIWSTHVWNMFDFGCAARDEGGVKGRNNKGLVTIDRKIRKEAFYVYKAYWSKEAFVYVCGRRYAQRAMDKTTVKVYSNQPRVTLLVNGTEFATLEADKIFVFENVPMNDGFTQITAVAGDCKDSIALEKVAEKPSIYTLPPDNDEELCDGAANWFDQAAAIDANAPMEFPEDRLSIRSTINEIVSTDAGYALLANALHTMTGMKMKRSMLGMMGGKTLEGMMGMMAGMAGGKNIPEDIIKRLNAALNQIKK